MGEVQDVDDVVVVGGGAAGLAAALVLARSRRSVVVVDGGQPRNAPAAGVHGYLTRDGMPPAELSRVGRLEVQGYGGRVVDAQVDHVLRGEDGRLTAVLTDGRRLVGRRLLVATGLVDELPDVPGLRERWGRDVLHCPYCHGWEVRDQTVAVLASGPMSVHQALLFRQLTDDVVYLAHLLPPTAEQTEQLEARGVRIVTAPVDGLEVEQERLVGVRTRGGTSVPCRAVVVATYMRARTGFLHRLGLSAVPHPSGVADHLVTDGAGRTDAAGVWAAGNVTDPSAQVGASAAAGAAAGAHLNADLVAEDTRRAVEAARAAAASRGARDDRRRRPERERVVSLDQDVPAGGEFGPEYWEERYRQGRPPGSPAPSPSLAAECHGLAPGRALDAGCGRGADAVWLAARGWHVTAVDVSASALADAEAAGRAAGPHVAAALAWVCADLAAWEPGERRFDLVSCQYVHAPGPARDLFRRLASWVAPGGTLLVVGHDGTGGGTPGGAGDGSADGGAHGVHAGGGARTHEHPPHAGLRPEEVAAALVPEEWTVLVSEPRTHSVRDPAGRGVVTLHDVVVKARRRTASQSL